MRRCIVHWLSWWSWWGDSHSGALVVVVANISLDIGDSGPLVGAGWPHKFSPTVVQINPLGRFTQLCDVALSTLSSLRVRVVVCECRALSGSRLTTVHCSN